jgi:hypothetical protein
MLRFLELTDSNSKRLWRLVPGRDCFKNQEERAAFELKLKEIASRHYEQMPNGLFRLKEDIEPRATGSLEENLKALAVRKNGTPDHVACQAVTNRRFMAKLEVWVCQLSGTNQFYTISSGSMSAILGTSRDSNGIDHVVHITRVDPHDFMLNRPDRFMLQPYPGKSSFRNNVIIKGNHFSYYVDIVPKVRSIRELAEMRELSSYDTQSGLDELSIIESSMLMSALNANTYGEEVDSKNTCLLPNGQIIPCDPNSLSERDSDDPHTALAPYRNKLLLEIPAHINQSALFSYKTGNFQTQNRIR